MFPQRMKHHALCKRLREFGKVVVAFSSGVDSTFLLQSALDVLGNQVLAVTAQSRLFPKREFDEAVQFANEKGIEHVIIDFNAFNVDGLPSNPPDRCYRCKLALFSQIRRIADERDIVHVIEGSNADDMHDYRPGMRAIAELGILSPLRESGLTKQEIRRLSEERGLPTWNKPSAACLASRIPYGEEITVERLTMIEAAEQCLLSMGFRQVRVRLHGNLARIEMGELDFHRLLSGAMREEIYVRFRELGFAYISADLLGYRVGSMNEVLAAEDGCVCKAETTAETQPEQKPGAQ